MAVDDIKLLLLSTYSLKHCVDTGLRTQSGAGVCQAILNLNYQQ